MAETQLPFWSQGQTDDAVWSSIADDLESSSGLVLCTPEWDGMATPALKNFLLYCSGGIIAHKAALIVTVSASAGGSYPAAELRLASNKNCRLCFVPETIVIREVEGLLCTDQSIDETEARLRARIDCTLELFWHYAEALRSVRRKGLDMMKDHRFGM